MQKVLDNGRFKKFYNVVSELGRGAYGRVYKVLNTHEEQTYAVKIIAVPFDGLSNPAHHKYFREVKSILNLNHLNIVR